jgi:hypothetical protein
VKLRKYEDIGYGHHFAKRFNILKPTGYVMQQKV